MVFTVEFMIKYDIPLYFYHMPLYDTIIGNNINAAKGFLEAGNVVGIPTETVYGLAGNALNEEAVLKIFSVKNRPHFDPLIVHTHSHDEITKYAEEIPAKAQVLMRKFMPGPLTLLLKKKRIVPDLVTSGLDTVAIRIPNHHLTLSLLKELSFPLAAPSANPFSYISPTSAQHVFDQLHGKIPYILDGGATEVGVESTIVGFEGDETIVYRLGGLSVEELEAEAGAVRLEINESSNPKAPGTLKSHYAPRKKLILLDESLNAGVLSSLKKSQVGIIAFDKPVEGFSASNQTLLSPKGDLHEAAKNLFDTMRKLDASNVDLIVAVKFPELGLGKAINDRLKRASSGL